MSKRILAMLLAVMLLVGMLPTNLFAFTANAEEVSVSMEALRAETEITVDGDFSETAWSNWTKIPASAEGAPSGGVAAAWDLEKLYLAINADADTAVLTVNDTALTVNLSDGTVTGAANANSKAGTNGVVEISIPLASLGIALSKYDQSVAISGSLSKGGVTSALAANKLIFSGKVAAVADYSSLAVGTDLLFLGCDYSIDGNAATVEPTSGTSYFIDATHTIDLKSGFLMSYDLEFTKLAVVSEPSYAGGVYKGFSHFVMAADTDCVYYSIYRPSEDGDLMLAVMHDTWTGQSTFPLNRGLNEKFQLTYEVYPDHSVDFFVDGKYLGTVENAVFSSTAKSWSYWRFTDPILGNSSFTISNVKTLQPKYTGNLPLTTGNLNALVAENGVQLDGAMSEPEWSSWAKVMPAEEGAPSGGVAAAWNTNTLYLAIKAKNADTAVLKVKGTELTVNLSTGVLTGADGAVSAVGSNGEVEISIPMASLGIAPYQYEQSMAISGRLSKNGVNSPLAADKLILTGKVATAVDISASTATGQFTINGNSATLNTPTAASFFLYVSTDILGVDGFAEAYNLKFTALPESAGRPTYTAGRYTGFNHYFLSSYDNPNSAAAKVQAVVYGIYRTAGSGLMLVVRGDNDTEDYTFDLNRGLNEEFQLTCQTYADGSAELFVDGASLGTVNGAVHWKSGFGKEFSLWRYFDEAGQNVNCTISDVRMFETKYSGIFDVGVETRSISLTGNIALNYFMKLPETVINDETAHMLFTLPDGSTEQVFVKGAVKEDDGRYRFSCAVAAREMTGTIKAQFIYNGGSTKVYDYSIRDYAKEEELPDSGVLKDLLDAMLRYGGSAQRYFGTNKDDQADANNRWSEEALNNVTVDTLSSYKMERQNTEGAVITSASLFLRSETTLRVYFTVADGTEFTVLDGTTPLTAVKDGDRYYVDIENIAAQHLEEKHQITVKDSNSNTLATASVSALSYCHMVLTAAKTTAGDAISDELKELAKALYLYNQAANAYFI